MNHKFSIIIPVKAINAYVRETVHHVINLEYENWELFILPNENDAHEWDDHRIRIIATGKIGPGLKRDIGAECASGDVLVFLDDDSYPKSDLLNVAINAFANKSTIAIGGPGITPLTDPFWARVSGAVFLSKLSGGAPERYIPSGFERTVADWPSVNLMVRKSVFNEVGGFDTEYWPGEDTQLCLKILKLEKGFIKYIPKLIVWHHRRRELKSHLMQVSAYGLHRGYFTKKFPETSRKIKYFMPTLIVFLLFVSSVISILFNSPAIFFTIFIPYALVVLAAAMDITSKTSFLIGVCVIPYIFITHISYGVSFFRGVCTSSLRSKLR